MAYFYRGHFIYACPAGNPIEPIPFSTRRGISIVGTVQDCAPAYDPQARDLVPEGNIAALDRACIHMQQGQQRQDQEQEAEETERASAPPGFTPHNRAQFLAQSAPGSQHASATNTPFSSRPTLPSYNVDDHGLLQPISSISRLTYLPTGSSSSKEIDHFAQNASHPASSSTSRRQSPSSQMSRKDSNTELYLHGLGHIDKPAQRREITSVPYFPLLPEISHEQSLQAPSSAPAHDETSKAKDTKIEMVFKCPIHDETCDGITTTNKHLTARAREFKAFKDLYPTITGSDGRVMIDWARLFAEERAEREL